MNINRWKYVKPLKNRNILDEFEKKYSYALPDKFKECVIKNNGGRPSLNTFDTDIESNRVIKSFLSFNNDDKENIWEINEYFSTDCDMKYIAFAIDNFGNLICFSVDDNSIIFYEHEENKIEYIAESFTEYLSILRPY